MNILFVTGLFVKENQNLGGMPNYIYKATTSLKERGHNTYILAADDENREWEYKGIKVFSVKTCPHVTRFAWIAYGMHAILRDLVLQRKIKKLVKQLNIDIIQYTGWFGVGILHSKKLGIPAVMRMSSYAKIQLVSAFTESQIKVISKMERLAAKNMDGIFAPSKIIADTFGKDIGREVKVIETPFKLGCSKENWDYSLWTEKFEGKKYLFFFGRLTPDKGILTIKRALYDILEKYRDITFVFAGDTVNIDGRNIVDILKDNAGEHRNRIIYLGSLKREQLYPMISKAYAVLLPSLMDNLPNSCMEAMYLEKSVIGTKGTSLDQMIEDGVSGLLIEPDDEDGLISKINILMNMDHNQLEMMGKKAKERISNMHPDKTIKQLMAYYRNFTDK